MIEERAIIGKTWYNKILVPGYFYDRDDLLHQIRFPWLKNIIIWGYCKKANVSHIERHQRDLYEGVEIWLNILITGRNKYYIPSKFLEITLFAVTS